jgi:N-acetylglutamate synthase-like GNAT family acetyltransferase
MKNNQFTIRPGIISDLERIIELEKRNWPPGLQVDKKEFEKRLKTFSQGFLMMLNEKEKIIGTSTAFLFPEKFTVEKLNATSSKTTLHDRKGIIYYLHAISIDKDYRGKNLGTTLVKKHEENARKFACSCIYLIAAESEAPFYLKLGFNRISEYSPYKDTKMAGFEKMI